MTPTVSIPADDSTDRPTFGAEKIPSEEDSPFESDPWYTSMFKSREHEGATSESNSTYDSTLITEDDDTAILEPATQEARKLTVEDEETWRSNPDNAIIPSEQIISSLDMKEDSGYAKDLSFDSIIDELQKEMMIVQILEDELKVEERIKNDRVLLKEMDMDDEEEHKRVVQQQQEQNSSLSIDDVWNEF